MMAVFSDLRLRIQSFIGSNLLVYQAILTGIALVVGSVFWLLRGSAGFVDTFLYTLIIGNFTAVGMAGTSRLFSSDSVARNWAVFLATLLPVSVLGAALSSLAIYVIHPSYHVVPMRTFIFENIRFGVFVTLVTGVVLFSTNSARERLEAANRLLQDQVQLGAIRLDRQAAELTAAHDIQAHLIPTLFPQLAGLQVSGAWQPAQAVGGDYFDVLSFTGRRLALTIADVSGKGMGAALLMANLQAAFRAFATEETTPAALCGKLNRALCSSIAPGKFVTFFYGILDADLLVLRYENAGHNPPVLLRAGQVISLDGGGTVLGLFPEAPYEERTFQLAPGDCLLLTTDGITEAANPENLEDEFGEARLIDSARLALSAAGSSPGGTAHAIRTRILGDVTAFCDGHFHDDASLIVLTIDT